jgi:SAM-dependent methyltransferase
VTVSEHPTAVYSIEGGHVGRNRLRVLSGVFAPTTAALFDRVQIAGSARCLDAGCGGGDVTTLLAERVPNGHVTGVDIDSVKIALASPDAPANVSYHSEDLATTVQRREQFDLVYARFVLSHLAGADRWVRALTQLVAPGGTLVVEDTHIAATFCAPPSAAFARCIEIYSATVRANGGDPDIGPSLPLMLAGAGLHDVGIQVVQPAALHGDAKRIQLLTLAAIESVAIELGISTSEEIATITADLEEFVERPDTVVTTAQVVQTWGSRPATPDTLTASAAQEVS